MTIRYREVQFVPNRASAWRIPVAALVEAEGGVEVVFADAVPSGKCVGGPHMSTILDAELRNLKQACRFDTLAGATGPKLILGEPVEVPVQAGSAAQWLRKHVLPSRSPRSPDATETGRHRTAWHARKFLHDQGIGKYVTEAFDARDYWGPDITLPAISQAVPGAREVLLMEPLFPWQSRFTDAVVRVRDRVGNAKLQAQRQGLEPAPSFLAYVLPGGTPDQRSTAMAELRTAADLAFDVAIQDDLRGFKSRVEEVGRSAPSGPLVD